MRGARFVRLIPWTLQSGSEQEHYQGPYHTERLGILYSTKLTCSTCGEIHITSLKYKIFVTVFLLKKNIYFSYHIFLQLSNIG
jgi:hypothetical protein